MLADKIIKEFTDSKDTVKSLAINISHLSSASIDMLESVSAECDNIMSRKYGFVIKLFEECENGSPSINLSHFSTTLGLQEDIVQLLFYAYESGYRIVEFDTDAQVYDNLVVYE